jgi:hypothetical protein
MACASGSSADIAERNNGDALLSDQGAPMPDHQNRIMIYGPKNDGTYIIEFKTAAGEALAISVPAGETRVLKHLQARMPYGLLVPDVDPG